MTTNKIAKILQKDLPDFTIISGADTPHEENWNSIRIVRDGQELVLDVCKVDNEDALEKLEAYVIDMWKRSRKVIEV